MNDTMAPAAPAGHAHAHGHGHGHGRARTQAQRCGHGHGRDAARAAGQGHAHGLFGAQAELLFSLLSGAALLLGWGLARAGLGGPGLVLGCYLAGYFFGGFHPVREAWDTLRQRRFEIDTLMLVAAAGAAALGAWAEGALLLFLFSLGHALEHHAMGRVRQAVEALGRLAPETATLLHREGALRVLPVGELEVGDVVVVRPHERLPADGVVRCGSTSIDESPVTGESLPLEKSPHPNVREALAAFEQVAPAHRVFAGTLNGSGAIEVAVARRAAQSTLARVADMVAQAQARRSPTQQFTQRFARLFVPAVLALVGLLLCAGLVLAEPFSTTFYRAMAVLVAASPCALAISVPSAVLSGIARAGRGGVLIKGGGALEDLGAVQAIAFDKTGTLTEGQPVLTDAVPVEGIDESTLLSVALAVEQHSAHPLAAAIVAGARQRLGEHGARLQARDVRSITGRGVSARIGSETVHIGKATLFAELAEGRSPAGLPDAVAQIDARLVGAGRTTMVVRAGSCFLGVLGVMDRPRPEAPGLMQALRSLGVRQLAMISGDNRTVARAVGRAVGLDDARGDLMPEQKMQAVLALRRQHGKVAMVGDGVNDAPALAAATVGIAMGAAGSDVALETADVALMADSLAQLPFAIGLSRTASRIIRQNLVASLGVVAVLIPATIFGMGIGSAILLHEGSTLLVVVNALRLLAYRGPSA